MTQRCLRITATALTLAAVLALPAHAAGPKVRTPGIHWVEDVVQWVARVWVGTGQGWVEKYGAGIDPNGNPAPPSPSGFSAGSPNGASSDQRGGLDPDS